MAVYLHSNPNQKGGLYLVGADTAQELARWAIRMGQMVEVTKFGVLILHGNLPSARKAGAKPCPKGHFSTMVDRNVYQIRKYGGVKKLRSDILCGNQ